ncbi:hypothetical protein WKI27_01905 [Brevundimonas vesicularis]|uniref:hypothetical protein n=1 Tax=Brevundimonas vesicularis TaxID=41276 RepID=UPI0030C16E2C
MASKPPIPAEDFNAVVEAAHLLDIKLISSEFSIQASFFGEPRDNIRFAYGCEPGAHHFNAEDGRLIGTFFVEAGAKKSRKFLMKAKATYLIAFSVEGNPTEDSALAYLRKIGAFGCWPYFRSHFAALCANAGAEAPPLPIMTGNLPTKIT